MRAIPGGIVSPQFKHDTRAFAFGVGEKSSCFGDRRFHGKTLSDFKYFATSYPKNLTHCAEAVDNPVQSVSQGNT
jgi:hypothetical protein